MIPSEISGVVERFDHVSIAVRDKESVAPLVALLGGSALDSGYEDRGDFDWAQFMLPGDTKLEVISTTSSDPDHFITRFIAERGEGLHHLTFKVADIAAATLRAEEMGFRTHGFDDSGDDWKEVFIHPKSTHGVLIQFAEFGTAE